MPPYIKTDPDLLGDDHWSWIRGIGTVRSAPRRKGYWESRSHHEQVADYYASNPNGDFYARYRGREPSGDIRSSLGNDWSVNVPGGHDHRPSSGAGLRDGSNSSSNFNDLINNLGAYLARDMPGQREPFGSWSEEYATRPPSYRQPDARSPIKKEEVEESSLFIKDDQRATPSATPKQSSPPESLPARTQRDSTYRPSSRTPRADDPGGGSPDRSPPPPRPRRLAHRIPLACTCPIDLHCAEKQDHEIDCRPLVPEWEQWRPVNGGLLPNEMPEPGDDDMEIFADLAEMTKFIQICDDIERLPKEPGRIEELEARTRTFQQVSVTEDILAAPAVIPRLQSFLAPENAEPIKKKGVTEAHRENLLVLLRKWERGDLSALANRGLRRANDRGQYVMDPDYPHRRSAADFGNNELVNGQTWLTRTAMARDGAHGMPRAGIHGTIEKGAYAIVMGLHLSKYKYADVDFGKTIYYIGTALRDEVGAGRTNDKDSEEDQTAWGDKEATNGTKALMKSHEESEPVRVFRSYRAAKIVPGKPKDCYRYDGLYKVVDYECLKAQRQIYRFKMVRLNMKEDKVDQGPLRGWERVEQEDARARKAAQKSQKGRGFAYSNARRSREEDDDWSRRSHDSDDRRKRQKSY